MKIDNWSIIGNNNPYLAPELRSIFLHGIVDDHPRLGKNIKMTSSRIVTAEGLTITTKSGSVYELGNVDPKYLEYLKENNIEFNPEQPITFKEKRMWRIKYLFRWLKWIFEGRPTIKYPGKNCGCCGTWIGEEFTIPAYQSNGGWWDTWGLCEKGTGCRKNEIQSKSPYE